VKRLTISTVVALVLGAARVAGAADLLVLPAPRQGYYVSVGGAGVLGRAQDDKRHLTLDYPGGTLSMHFGQLITERFGAGLHMEYGAAKHDRRSAGLAGIGFESQVVAVDTLALHLEAGVGYFQTVNLDDKTEPSRGTGGAYYGAGLTYDLFLTSPGRSGGWALTPGLYAKYLPGDHYRTVVLWAGLSLSWWSGLPRQALELPPDQAFTP
jgi:hypothetical protein